MKCETGGSVGTLIGYFRCELVVVREYKTTGICSAEFEEKVRLSSPGTASAVQLYPFRMSSDS